MEPLSTVLKHDCDRHAKGVERIPRPSWATAIGRDAYGLWATLDFDGVCQRLRWIPPGLFWMGSFHDDLPLIDFETPQHEVRLMRGFWLFDTPCTQALWRAVMDKNPSYFEGHNRPVECVSWNDCQKFITRLNRRFDGLNLGLPTEAEWEYACRAGAKISHDAEDLDTIAWYQKNSHGKTHEVGQKKANAWGLYDMLGNVFEWCHDGGRTYSNAPVVDPMGPTDFSSPRVIRGGSWDQNVRRLRPAYRFWSLPCTCFDLLGFRCTSSGQGKPVIRDELKWLPR